MSGVDRDGSPDQGSPDQTSPDDTAAEVDPRQEYQRLQRQLQGDCSPSESVLLLRQLAVLRRRIANLPEAPQPTEDLRPQPTNDRPAPNVDEPEPRQRQEPPASVEPGSAPDQLSIRFLIEGPESQGIGSFVDSLRAQFHATSTEMASRTTDLRVHWLEFEAGSFESKPIAFQVMVATGQGTPQARHTLRAAADTIIVIIDGTPAGIRSGTRAVSTTLDDCQSIDQLDRPEIAVFAHRSDAPDALSADDVAAELLVESSIRVIPTTEEGGGFFYGFAVATNTAVRRAQLHWNGGRPTRPAIDLAQLLATTNEAFEVATTRPEPPVRASERPPRVERKPLPSRPPMPPSPPSSPLIRSAASPATTPPLLSTVASAPTVNVPPNDDARVAKPGGRRASALRRLISALRAPDEALIDEHQTPI